MLLVPDSHSRHPTQGLQDVRSLSWREPCARTAIRLPPPRCGRVRLTRSMCVEIGWADCPGLREQLHRKYLNTAAAPAATHRPMPSSAAHQQTGGEVVTGGAAQRVDALCRKRFGRSGRDKLGVGWAVWGTFENVFFRDEKYRCDKPLKSVQHNVMWLSSAHRLVVVV